MLFIYVPSYHKTLCNVILIVGNSVHSAHDIRNQRHAQAALWALLRTAFEHVMAFRRGYNWNDVKQGFPTGYVYFREICHCSSCYKVATAIVWEDKTDKYSVPRINYAFYFYKYQHTYPEPWGENRLAS